MLVLSRKCDQSILVGDDITITVLAIDGDRVKLGIEAPRSIPVLRSEVFQQLQTSNAGASHSADRSIVHTVAEAMRHRGQPVQASDAAKKTQPLWVVNRESGTDAASPFG